jgi:hypothetical protein
MLLKAAVMGLPLVGSRTSPTALALTLAERLNITVVGYIRPSTMNVYTHAWRSGVASAHPAPAGMPWWECVQVRWVSESVRRAAWWVASQLRHESTACRLIC